MNAELVHVIERSMNAPDAAEASQDGATVPAHATPGAASGSSPQDAPPVALDPLDQDRLDRLTLIIDRTRLALGVAAARQLWPMLGLPALRTSPLSASDGRRRRDFGTADLFGKPQPEGAPGIPVGGVLDGVRGAGARQEPPKLRALRVVPPPPRECVARFIEERCEVDPQAETGAAAFREAYRTWALANGLPVPIAMTLGKFAVGLGVHKRKTMGVSVYGGIRLKAAPVGGEPSPGGG